MLALLGGSEAAEGDAARRVLESFGVTAQHVRLAILRMMGMGVEPEGGELPLTGQAKDAIDLAPREARGRGRQSADTDDLLLALLRERHGAAARILLQLDADPGAIRSALVGV